MDILHFFPIFEICDYPFATVSEIKGACFFTLKSFQLCKLPGISEAKEKPLDLQSRLRHCESFWPFTTCQVNGSALRQLILSSTQLVDVGPFGLGKHNQGYSHWDSCLWQTLQLHHPVYTRKKAF